MKGFWYWLLSGILVDFRLCAISELEITPPSTPPFGKPLFWFQFSGVVANTDCTLPNSYYLFAGLQQLFLQGAAGIPTSSSFIVCNPSVLSVLHWMWLHIWPGPSHVLLFMNFLREEEPGRPRKNLHKPSERRLGNAKVGGKLGCG